jgi:hypothetical protein
VAEAIDEDGDLELRPLRPRYLKDIGRVPLFSVARPGEAMPTWRARARPLGPPAREVAKAVLTEVVRRRTDRRAAVAAAAADTPDGDAPD